MELYKRFGLNITAKLFWLVPVSPNTYGLPPTGFPSGNNALHESGILVLVFKAVIFLVITNFLKQPNILVVNELFKTRRALQKIKQY